jgi:RNA polymerase sigma factor (sigma-70 family)
MWVEQQNRTLTPQAFHRLLDWFDQGKDSEGSSYLEMRRRLVNYFDRKNVPTPDDLAQETLRRVALRLEEKGITESEALARYCYVVARFVLMEHLRSNKRSETLLREMKSTTDAATCGESEQVDTDEKERMLNYVEECMDTLDRTSREIITLYYAGKEQDKFENRRALAERLAITQNALSIRACRIREKLESCVKDCLAKR